MVRTRQLAAAAKPQGRSRTTNGAQLLDGIDGRSAIARCFRDILRKNSKSATEAERVLVRQAATLAVARLVNGELIDADTISKLSGQLRRILADLRRKAQASAPDQPSIHEHLAANYGADVNADEEDDD
jgi:hypothetical protein